MIAASSRGWYDEEGRVAATLGVGLGGGVVRKWLESGLMSQRIAKGEMGEARAVNVLLSSAL